MTFVKAVFGLGNPGIQYNNTRHNAGFDVLDTFLASSENGLWSGFSEQRLKMGGQIIRFLLAESNAGEGKKVLIKPLTFMNLSGLAFKAVVEKYELPFRNCLIVCDDVHLELGRLRARSSGSAGGQNGLKSVMQEVGSEEVPRLRIGVGGKSEHQELSDHVLSRWSKSELTAVKQVMVRAAEAINVWFEQDIETVMNQFNASIKNEEQE